ncbi:hypothetical protein diail_6298 [Diaporthe ilicicola]|nr:hypothetical protein diail_6298 [Diaporthe ilicicola]
MQTPPLRPPSECTTISSDYHFDDIPSITDSGDDHESTRTRASGAESLISLTNRHQRGCDSKNTISCSLSEKLQKNCHKQDRNTQEEPKVIATNRKKPAFGYFLVIHSIPVAGTLALFWLYLKGFQWQASDVQLKSLLFAAKLHESLILVSLGDVLFHRIRYHLLTSRGVSFGLLVSPFRISDPTFLFQSPFLASTTFAFKSAPELLTISLIVLVSVLALLAAPSSGALMIPRYDWWLIPDGGEALKLFKKKESESAMYIGASYDDLFPLLIDGRFGPDSARDDRLEPSSFSDRFEHILSGLDQILVDDSMGATANVTVVDGATVDSFAMTYKEQSLDECELLTCQNISMRLDKTIDTLHTERINCLDMGCESLAAQVTSPLALVTQELFDRYRAWISVSKRAAMIKAKPRSEAGRDLDWKQPSVSMQCSTILHENLTANAKRKLRPVSFDDFGSFPPFSLNLEDSFLESLEKIEERGTPNTTYVDIAHLLPDGITASTALLMYDGKNSPNDTSFSVYNPMYLCLVDARWIESQVWFTAPYATIMRSGISIDSVWADTGTNATKSSPTIAITTEYANSLDSNLTVDSDYQQGQGRMAQTQPFAFIRRYCGQSVPSPLGPKCAMLAHTLYLTDSLRRTQSLFRYYSASSMSKSDLKPENLTRLDYQLYHQLHAYKFEGLIVKLSMSVLLLHVMLVYAHFLLLVAGDGWYSRAWSELGELIALAILTRPSALLQNAAGGVKNWRTWKLRTFIREVTPEGRLELILKETVGSPRVLSEDEGQERVHVELEVNRRYG